MASISGEVFVTTIPENVYTFTTTGFGNRVICADKGLSSNISMNSMIVRYGEGYTKRYGKGLNPQSHVYTLSLANRHIKEINDVKSFLDARGRVESFALYIPNVFNDPAIEEVRVVCDNYRVSIINENFGGMEISLRKVYESIETQ